MLDLVVSWSYYVLYLILDFVLYILVDIVVKTCLKEASDEQEKRVIWLWESALLAFLCFFISICHHIPWLLMSLSLLTLLYTQLLGRINFRYWWWQLVTRWDEFEQHEESMEVYNSRNINPPNVSVQPGQTFIMNQQPWPPMPNQQMPPMMPQPQMTFQNDPNVPQAEPWYPSDSLPSMKKQPVQVYIPKNNEMRFRGQNVERSPYTPVLPRGKELIRRPIHGSVNKSLGLSSRLKATFMSAIGMGPQTSPGPPGLQNNGQNVCFMNAVLQCLAHSPALATTFDPDVKPDLTDTQRPLVSAFADVLRDLTSGPESWGTASSLSLIGLRKAASLSNAALVVNPDGGMKQGQQDAAEFLMWLLDALHVTLNSNVPQAFPGEEGDQNSSSSRPRFSAWTLRMLKYIYGDLTPQRIQELKLSCRSEIERANGLDNASYAEPIQRLSDLEWLTYKGCNMSLMDDLFTGQMVEAQHCTACNRISVNIQTFNILPVPIVGPRQLSGIVHLDDCFAKFGTIEELFGTDGLHCDSCNHSFHTETVTNSVTPVRRPDLSNGIMSPIPNNSSGIMSDSSVNENLFKTSTPIRGAPVLPRSVKVTDGQRRSLLRQLPECLVVQLLRFTFHQGQPRKVYRPVSIPLTNLDLTGLVIDNVMKREDLTALHACFQYQLYGLVLHLGGESTCYGHYVAYVLASNNLWYKFDDQIVTEVNMEYELNTREVRENAYLLFYNKNTATTP